jgi:small subunit ribosomal protein S3
LRTDRSRYEKFRAGYLPKCGEPALKYMRKAEVPVQLKPGTLGVKVRIMPPDAEFPDKTQIAESHPEEETTETFEEKAAEEKTEEKSGEEEDK